LLVIAVVVLAAALHASWNAIVKSIDDRLTVMAVLGLATTVVCLPVALLATPPPGDALPFLIGSVVVHGIYNLLLVALYGDTDFNQAYPLARGISPPTVALFAVLVVGEALSVWQIGGLVILSAGLLVVALPGSDGRGPGRAGRRGTPRSRSTPRSRGTPRSRRTVCLAALTGLSIATYTVLDGLGVRRCGTPFGYGGWLFVAEGIIVPVVWTCLRLRAGAGAGSYARRLRSPRVPRDLIVRAAVAGVISVLAYGLVLWAQTRGELAIVAGLRETSVVFGAAIGATVFGERLGSRRIAASVLIAAGAVALSIT
jgi:drug/metabolite transporter (DMT)-like permease